MIALLIYQASSGYLTNFTWLQLLVFSNYLQHERQKVDLG